MPPTERQLARALAILEHGQLTHTAALAGIDGDAAVAAADALVGAGILAPRRPLEFVHPIVRAAVYSDIGTAERADAHRRAARVLAEATDAPERVVEHLLAADRAGDSWVVTRLVTAARDASRSGAPELAAVYLRRALEEPPPPSERAALLLELGVAEDNAGQIGALGHMRVAVESAADEHARLAAAVVLGHALARDNRFEEAVEVLDRALAAGSPEQTELTLAAEALVRQHRDVLGRTAPANARRISAARRRADGVAPTPEQLALAAQLAVRANEPAETGAELARRALATAHGKRPRRPISPGITNARSRCCGPSDTTS